jgi:aminopeptidase N
MAAMKRALRSSRRRGLLLAILLSALCVSPAGAGDAPAAWQIADYAVELALDLATQSFAGDETITLRAPQGGGAVVELAAFELKVTEASEAGEPVPFEQRDGKLRLTLPRPASAGEVRTLRLRYAGEKPTSGLRFSGSQAFTAFNTSRWLPCQDDPAAKATLSLALVVPAGLEAVGSGRLLGRGELPDGRLRFRFRQDRPHSTYLFGFTVGRFQEATLQAGPVALRFLSPSLTPAELRQAFRATPAALAFFERRAGVPLPGGAYTQVLMPDAPAQEMASLALMSDAYGRSVLEDPREDYLLAHELAHQWWGNLLTCRTWSDFWLNEGMATWMGAAFKEHFWGPDEYERDLAIAHLRYDHALAQGASRTLVSTGWKKPSEMGGAITYSRGALVLHHLRRQLGDAAFWAGLRDYTRAGAGGSVETADLRAAMERASGQDLRRFFDQWVFRPRPDLVARHRLVPGGVDVEIEQRQPGPWTFPLEIAVATAGRRIARQVTVTRVREVFHFTLDGPVLSVAVDPAGDLPETVAHERPIAMLLHQLAAEPALWARVGALGALETLCAPEAPGRSAACEAVPAAVERTETEDAARLMRQLAAEALETLQAPISREEGTPAESPMAYSGTRATGSLPRPARRGYRLCHGSTSGPTSRRRRKSFPPTPGSPPWTEHRRRGPRDPPQRGQGGGHGSVAARIPARRPLYGFRPLGGRSRAARRRSPAGRARAVIVLDTNVLSALMRREPDPAVVTWLDRLPPESV